MKEVKFYNHFNSDSDLDGGTYFKVLKVEKDETPSDEELFENYDLCPSYNGPGQRFRSQGRIQRRKKYIILSQTWGYDV